MLGPVWLSILVTGHLHREKSVPSLRTVSHCIAEYLCMSCHSKHLVCFASHDVCCLFTFSACSVSLTTKVRMVKKQRSASRVGKSGGRLQLCRKQGESAQLTKVWAQFLMTSIQETAYSKHSVGFWAGIVNLLVMCFQSDVMGALQMQGHLQRETSFASVRNMSRCRLLFAVCRLPVAVCRLPFAVCCLLFAVCCLLFAVCRLLFAVCC